MDPRAIDAALPRRISVDSARFDISNAAIVKEQIARVVDQGDRDIVLDLSKVEFMDSSGLGVIVGAFKYVGAEGSLRLADVTEPVKQVLRLTRMDRVLAVDGSE